MHFSIEQFWELRDYIYKKTGLKFEDTKLFFFKRRIENLLENHKFTAFEEFVRYIRFYDNDGTVFRDLIGEITTHETYFFREFEQLQGFAEVCLPEIIEEKIKKYDNTLNIWSAACSTGEEAYTLAIILREMLDDYQKWKIHIYATDIDDKSLEIAKKGIYTDRSVKFMPPDYQEKYIFRKGCGLSVIPELKKNITFDYLNFMDAEQMQSVRCYDFIFCRNALIYFDDDSRREVVMNFYQSLNSNGYLFLGHSESINRITNLFKMKRKEGHILYYKE